jgi:hypothetical protein
VSEGPAIKYDLTANSSEVEAMQIRLGYELVYDCPQPTPMLLMLNVHYTRVSDMVVSDHLVTSPSIPIGAYRDCFGNWCSRIVAPTGRTRLSAKGIKNDTGEPDVVSLPTQISTLLRICPTTLCRSSWPAAIARPTDFPRSPGRYSRKTPLGWGPRLRPSATTFTSTLPSVMNTLAQAELLGKPTAIAPVSAAITRTSRSPSVAA